jgi:hypothetical protein
MSFRKVALASIALVTAGLLRHAPLAANDEGTRTRSTDQ